MSARRPKNLPLKEDFISRLSDRQKHLGSLLVILILPIIMFSEVTLGGMQFMGHDTIQWRAAAESIYEHRKAYNGEEPLWATHMFSGMPAYTISVQKSVPHIDNLIRRATDSIYPAAHLWIMMGGVYLLFQLMGMRPFVSLLGAVFISFTTYIPIIIRAGHNTKFIAFVFMPWVLAGYRMLATHERKLLPFVLFAISLTLEFRAGHPQVTYYFLYLLLFWWIYNTWLSHKAYRLESWVKTTGLMVVAGIVGLLGNAQQYWRLLEYSPHSTRGGSALETGGGGLDLEYAFSWSQGVGELFTLVIPGLFGGSSAEAYWGPKSVTSGPHYLGAVAVVLALFGIIYYRKKIKYVFLGTGLLTMLFSLGYHFPALNEFMFHYVPWFNKFRTPEMWLIVTVFCFSVLAVFGVAALFRLARSEKKSLKTLLIPLSVPLLIGVLFTFANGSLLSFEKQGERQFYARQLAQQNNVSVDDPRVQTAVSRHINNQLKPERREMATQDSIRFLVLVLLTGILIWAFYNRKLGQGLFLGGLVLMAAFDLGHIGNRYINEQAMVPERIDLEQQIQQRQRPLDSFIQDNIASGEGYEHRVLPLLDNPFNNAIPSYFYPTIGGYSGAKLSIYQDMIDRLIQAGPAGLNMELLDLLNVKYISVAPQQQLQMPGLTLEYEGQDGRVYENTDMLPRAFYVDSVVHASSPQEAMKFMQSPSEFNPVEVAVVENLPELDISADTSAKVTFTRYNARRMELQTQRSGPGYLVLSEIWYPVGWEVAIDGEPAAMYKTDYLLRGLPIPAGEHTLTLEFNPDSYVWGSRIAWASNLLQWGLAFVGLALWYHRRSGSESTPE